MAKPRLSELEIENFRSISGHCVIPLDGSITLVHGANGSGKTSVLSAIELAARGRVGFLEDQKGDTRSLLRHHDHERGYVRLTLTDTDAENSPRVGSFNLLGDSVTGKAALTEAEQTYFVERSFLPQTALGRLLDSYTDTGKQVDTALVRFVKSLVGLDGLDAIIDGLNASGDRRRSKKAVPSWARAADNLSEQQTLRREISDQLETARSALEIELDRLRTLVPNPESVGHPKRVDNDEKDPTKRIELGKLQEAQAIVDAISSLENQKGASLPGEGDAATGPRAEKAQTAYTNWEATTGAATLKLLNQIREDLLGLPSVSIGNLSIAFDEALERAKFLDRKRTERLAAIQSRAESVADLDLSIQNLDQRILALDKEAQAIQVSSDVRVLIEILELTIPITDSETCPICDEKFSGHGGLADHLSRKLELLSSSAGLLVSIERELSKLRKERLATAGKVILLKSLPVEEPDPPLGGSLHILDGLGDSVAEGAGLLREFQASQNRLAEETAQIATSAILESRIAEVARLLGISTLDLPERNPEVELAQEITKRIQELNHVEDRKRQERGARENVEKIQLEVERSQSQLAKVDKEIARLEAQLSRAETRMASAREVLQTAERTRSKLINEVFDQSLNSLWAQLFNRFAPAEPFTPRFVKQTEFARSVDVSLETALPDGKISGAPGAMLSYGNTNSAALALFMALHLSAPSELPWLIFDDPVQSMDDIHVANFAAIIRQLAYVHGRQVVIAVHQPELYEYLSLSLAPSDANHSLVGVTLDRGTGATTHSIDRVEFAEETRLGCAM